MMQLRNTRVILPQISSADAAERFVVVAVIAQRLQQIAHFARMAHVLREALDAVEIAAEAHDFRAAQLADVVDVLGDGDAVRLAVLRWPAIPAAGRCAITSVT